jgi:hypothetical protein
MRNLVLIGALALSACATAAAPGEPPVDGGGYVCRSDGLGQFVGQPATQALGADMLRTSGARILRWVGHGMAVTMDFSPQRLTVQLTPDNRVERANCG